RTAGGVRPGRGVRAVAGGVVRLGRHAARRRRGATAALTGERSTGPASGARALASRAEPALVPGEIEEAAEREDPEEPPLEAVEEVRPLVELGQLHRGELLGRCRILRLQ